MRGQPFRWRGAIPSGCGGFNPNASLGLGLRRPPSPKQHYHLRPSTREQHTRFRHRRGDQGQEHYCRRPPEHRRQFWCGHFGCRHTAGTTRQRFFTAFFFFFALALPFTAATRCRLPGPYPRDYHPPVHYQAWGSAELMAGRGRPSVCVAHSAALLLSWHLAFCLMFIFAATDLVHDAHLPAKRTVVCAHTSGSAFCRWMRRGYLPAWHTPDAGLLPRMPPPRRCAFRADMAHDAARTAGNIAGDGTLNKQARRSRARAAGSLRAPAVSNSSHLTAYRTH